MRLHHVITLRLSLLKTVLMALWAVFFYFAIIAEINDETDDSLEDYAEMIVTAYLAGEAPTPPDYEWGNRFRLREVSAQQAATQDPIVYADRQLYIEEKSEYEPVRTITYLFRTDDDRWMEIMVFTPTIDKDDLKEAIYVWLVILLVGMIVGMTLVNLWTVRRSMRSLRDLLAWLDAYSLGQKNVPLDTDTRIDEFRRLNEVARMNMERNEALYNQQKQFIANASHEMQTPLAVCANRLEMLLDDDSLTEEQMADIIKTLHTLEQLAETNRSLLLLCKIDNGQFADNVEVDLAAVAARMLPDLQTINAAKGIGVDADLRERVVATMDAALANILVSNLLRNAFTHNVQGGSIRVTSGPGRLTVANTAADGVALDESRIFERFYHSAHSKGSTGLGLAMAKAVCGQCSLGLSYRLEEGMHVFEIRTVLKNS